MIDLKGELFDVTMYLKVLEETGKTDEFINGNEYSTLTALNTNEFVLTYDEFVEGDSKETLEKVLNRKDVEIFLEETYLKTYKFDKEELFEDLVEYMFKN